MSRLLSFLFCVSESALGCGVEMHTRVSAFVLFCRPHVLSGTTKTPKHNFRHNENPQAQFPAQWQSPGTISGTTTNLRHNFQHNDNSQAQFPAQRKPPGTISGTTKTPRHNLWHNGRRPRKDCAEGNAPQENSSKTCLNDDFRDTGIYQGSLISAHNA